MSNGKKHGASYGPRNTVIGTYNPEVVIGTQSWLNEEINDAVAFRGDLITFRRDRSSRGGGVFICPKYHIVCRQI